MKYKKKFLIIFLFTISIHALAASHLMFIGAGGEGEKNDTIFDPTIKNIANYVKKNSRIKVNIALNGGHSKTEKLIKDSFPNAETKTDFQKSDYDRLIDSYKLKLENNEIVAGDQLMIYIDSHGAKKSGNLETHRIATSQGTANNLNTLKGASTVDLDQLKVIKDLAKAKGVKLAIIDGSCHSGNTLTLADENTCVISSTGPNHYAYTNFSQDFSAAMSHGDNLEEIFLQVRKKDTTPALPMISTQSGKNITALIYEKITPFLYHFNDKHDKLTPYLANGGSEELRCQSNYNALLETINEIEKLNTSSKKVLWWKFKNNKTNLKELKILLKKYQNALTKMQNEMDELNADRLNKKEIFKTSSHTVTYTWKEILGTDFKPLITDLQSRLKNESLSSNRTLIKDLITVYSHANNKRSQLLNDQPDLSKVTEKIKLIKSSIDSNYFTAAAIGKEERKLYSAMYQKDVKPNPCNSFKL